MRLIRVALENWRGVARRQIRFDERVTLIEGPNEIGKSTIIEAIRTLFRVMDSSTQKAIKAIQPVGQDTGSRVEAEVQAGDCHFIYAKTYNKGKQTTLDILAPKKAQFTGREAHEKAESILAGSVDMALWDALLVDQGREIAAADLGDSQALSRALDEAAGTAAAGSEDGALFDTVRAEYAAYFTPKTGKAKFAALEQRYDKARADVEQARAGLAEVEEDVERHERCGAEMARLRGSLPALAKNLEEHRQKWQSVASLKADAAAAEKELEAARNVLESTLGTLEQRRLLVADAAACTGKLDKAAERLQPLEERVKQLESSLEKAQSAMNTSRSRLQQARAALDLALDDQRYIENRETLTGYGGRIDTLREIAGRKAALLAVMRDARVDEGALEGLRKAEAARDLAASKRDMAITAVRIRAEKAVRFTVNGEEFELAPQATAEHEVTSELRLQFPGVVSVQITPPRSVEELQDEVETADARVAALLAQLGVASLADAIAANQKRQDAGRDLRILKEREQEVARDSSLEELEGAALSARNRCDSYLEGRSDPASLPASPEQAAEQVRLRRAAAERAEAECESARSRLDELRRQFSEATTDSRVLQEEVKGHEDVLRERQSRIDAARAVESDASLDARRAENELTVARLRDKLREMQARLAEAAPDRLQTMLANAGDACERAEAELRGGEQTLAVLSDRLAKAQADGRFENLRAAERDLEETRAELEATQRRAAAAELLLSTLEEHRVAARQAYVRPLKAAIEELAAMVFGAGCEVEVDDDWKLLSRTLNGSTVPFDSLSVGTQEQLGIITRLAAAQLVSSQGGVPLILDDSLGFSDPSRLETMGAAIATVGRRCQIVLITCTPGRFAYVGSAVAVKL